ncbi:MAG: antitoxin VapB family protein [Chthoniobacterales bacterium]
MDCVCVATKTISIDEKAYERLSMARIRRGESFSQVIHRAVWKRDNSFSGKELLKELKEPSGLNEAILEELEENQRRDRPPTDPWDA